MIERVQSSGVPSSEGGTMIRGSALRKLLRIVAVLAALLLVALGGVVAYAVYRAGRPIEAPYPPIRADRSPQGVARGAVIFHAVCEPCHRAPDSERAAGAYLAQIPKDLGTFYASNLTSDVAAGIGGLRDEEIARAIRYGVNRHGRISVMPGSAMGDADVAAVIGFLRSEDPLFLPDPQRLPPSRFSLLGKVIFALTGGFDLPAWPASGMPTPERAPTVEYGRYMADVVYGCGGCHTPGSPRDTDKVQGPDAYTGGLEMRDATGRVVISPNLTLHESGLGSWTREDFARALRDGIRPDGAVLRSPMPRFRGADDIEIAALWAYLASLPRLPGAAPRPPAKDMAPGARPDQSPEVLFVSLGCADCHAPGARYHANLARAFGRPAEDVARWILNPEAFQPGTQMPTYADLIDEPAALALARWIQAGGAERLPQ